MTNSDNGNRRTLIIGATGMLGAEILRQMCDSGKLVRATFRDSTDSAKRNKVSQYPAEVVSADLRNPESLTVACQQVTSVISTATAIATRKEGDTIQGIDELGQLALVEAAERAGVKHFVFLSFLPK